MAQFLNRVKDIFASEGRTQEIIRLRSLGFQRSQQSPASDTGIDGGNESNSAPRLELHGHYLTSFYKILKVFKTLGAAWNNRFSGWRSGLAGFTILACAILILNISILIWAATHLDEDQYAISTLADRGITYHYATLAIGNHEKISNISAWLHVGINFLSTALLAGSSYCMQCLSSPTRAEVDAAHARGRYLNIGILSWRNVLSKRKRRICLMLLLGLSSALITPIYDTSLIMTTATSRYPSAVISSDVVHGENFTFADFVHRSYAFEEDQIAELFQDQVYYNTTFWSKWRHIQNIAADRQLFNKSSWENISITDCANYRSFQAERSTLLVVTNETVVINVRDETVLAHSIGDATFGGHTRFTHHNQLILPYSPDEKNFDEWIDGSLYCLRRKEPGRNRLQIHLWLFLMATVLAAAKAVCFIFTFHEQQGTPLVTTGDAIVSFLGSPCVVSTDVCLLFQHELTRELHKRQDDVESSAVPGHREFQETRLRYYRSVGFMQWSTYVVLFTLTMLFSVYGFNGMKNFFRIDQTKHDLHSLWKMGLGKLNNHSLSTTTICYTGLLVFGWPDYDHCERTFYDASVMISANIPQLIVSGVYFCLNHQLTLMIQLRDWTTLASSRQSLRVSDPESNSDQISTYWLSLPYQYSIPLLATSASLGWLVSQTLFIVRYKTYDSVDNSLRGTDFALGFSAIGLIFTMVFMIIIFVASLAIGMCKCVPGMPLGPSNSLVIAAACHPPELDRYAGRKKVKWGAVATGRDNEDGTPDHCTITSRRVANPVEGRWYA